jgi:exodeoxyribonuclease-3
MKIVTWNVNGIRARKDEVLALVERERPDILCLQELKAQVEQIPEPLRDLSGYWSYWHGMKGYSGVALQVSKDFAMDPPRFSHPTFDHENRIVVADVGDLSVASIYVPNGGRSFEAKLGFLQELSAYAAAARGIGRRIVLCGDLNVARAEMDVHPKERNARLIGQRPEERALFERIIADGNLRDITRDLDPDNDALFTWWAPWRTMRERNIGWRLDYVLPSATLAERAVRCVSLRDVGTSDHGPVVATFDTTPATTPQPSI